MDGHCLTGFKRYQWKWWSEHCLNWEAACRRILWKGWGTSTPGDRSIRSWDLFGFPSEKRFKIVDAVKMCVAQARANAKLRDELNEALVIEDWRRHKSGPVLPTLGNAGWVSGCIRNKQLLYNLCLETCWAIHNSTEFRRSIIPRYSAGQPETCGPVDRGGEDVSTIWWSEEVAMAATECYS